MSVDLGKEWQAARARQLNERGALSVNKFIAIGKQVWPPARSPSRQRSRSYRAETKLYAFR